ncbi:hypothetical protein [Kitasatospora sp. NPDC057015]|uniref:hypothetical protein n=1 Tax=Kitasatospora sp. NPDC057015 TaxID=3346001 RepID=UPI00363DAF89
MNAYNKAAEQGGGKEIHTAGLDWSNAGRARRTRRPKVREKAGHLAALPKKIEPPDRAAQVTDG